MYPDNDNTQHGCAYKRDYHCQCDHAATSLLHLLPLAPLQQFIACLAVEMGPRGIDLWGIIIRWNRVGVRLRVVGIILGDSRVLQARPQISKAKARDANRFLERRDSRLMDLTMIAGLWDGC
jgi:hypothetical protein